MKKTWRAAIPSRLVTGILTLLITLAAAPLMRAGTHVWSGAQDGFLGNPANWSSGGAPSGFEAAPVIIQFPPAVGARREITNNVANLKVDVLAFYGGNYRMYALSVTPIITLNGGTPPFPYPANLLSGASTNNYIDASVQLILATNTTTVLVGTNATLTVAAWLTGPGGFTKTGPGTLTFYRGEGYWESAWAVPNDYLGTTTVLEGVLRMYKTIGCWKSDCGMPAVPNSLIVGDGTGTRSARAVVDYVGQIGTNCHMTINAGGKVEVNDASQALSLTLSGGQLSLEPYGYRDSFEVWHTNYPSFECGTTLTSYSSRFGNSAVLGYGDFSFKTASNSQPAFINVVSGSLLFQPTIYGQTHLNKIGEGEFVFGGTDHHDGDWVIREGLMVASGYMPFYQQSHSLTISNGAQLSFRGPGYAHLPIHMNGYGIGGTNGAIVIEHDEVKLDAFLHLDSDTAIVVTNAADTAKLGRSYVTTGYSFLSGPGTLTKKGRGTLELYGNQTNGMTMPFFVQQGTLSLNLTQGVAGVSSPLIIGHNLADGTKAEVKVLNQDQLPDDMPITINDSGTLNLNDWYETVGPITLQGGDIKTYGGVMYLSSDLLATNGVGSMISGSIHGGNARRTIHIAPGYGININGQLSDIGMNLGFDVDGGGTLTLSGYNAMLFGSLRVKAGVLYARSDAALGHPSGATIIENGARLAIDGRNLGAEPIILNGDGGDGYGAVSCSKTNTLNGPITLASDATINVVGDTGRLILGGEIKGANGLSKVGAGTLVFSGSQANTYGGTTVVNEGVLQLSKTGQIAVPGALVIGDNASPDKSHFVRAYSANQIAPVAPVTINTSGVLDLSGGFSPQTIGSLAGSGALYLGISTLTAGGNNNDTLFSGTMTGFPASSLIKQGTGKLSLWSVSLAWTGSTIINGGTVSLNGSHPVSPITINSGGTLSGNGTGGPIVANNGKVMPGNSTGLLKSGNVMLNATSQFEAEMNGTSAGVNYDQLSVTGTVNLGDATFAAKLGFGSAVSNQFVLIANDGNEAVTGKFKNLAEGAPLIIGGAQFKITYLGGDGNDVVLTQTSAVTAPQVVGLEKLADGNTQISGTGFANTTYKVEATQNLHPPAQWTTLGSILSDALGKMQFTDSSATNYPMRFYRFVLP